MYRRRELIYQFVQVSLKLDLRWNVARLALNQCPIIGAYSLCRYEICRHFWFILFDDYSSERLNGLGYDLSWK